MRNKYLFVPSGIVQELNPGGGKCIVNNDYIVRFEVGIFSPLKETPCHVGFLINLNDRKDAEIICLVFLRIRNNDAGMDNAAK